MTENEKIELFDKWYDENYDEWAEGEEGIALREELEQAFKGGIAELEKENAELKAQLESERDLPAIAYIQGAEKQKKKDEEELKKWKDEWQEQVQKATDEGYARTLQTMQLSKARELLAKWVELFKSKSDTALPTPIQVDTEQLLKETEK